MWSQILGQFSNHFILLGVAICVTLVAIWTGQSRLHWFWRGCVVAGVLALFLPVRAHEPLLFFLIAAPVVSAGVAWMESRRMRIPEERTPLATDSTSRKSGQLTLAEAFLLLGLIGMACGLGSAAIRGGLMMDWRCLPVSALTFATVALLAYRVGAFSQGMSHRWAKTVSFLIAAGLFAWYATCGRSYFFPPAASPLPVVMCWWSGGLLVCLAVSVVWYFGLRWASPLSFTALVGAVFAAPRIEVDGLGDWMFVEYLPLFSYVQSIVTIAYGLFAAAIVASAAIGRLAAATTAAPWQKHGARAAGVCAAGLILCYLGPVYWRLAWTLALPSVAVLPEQGENPLEKALTLLDEFYLLDNPGRGYVDFTGIPGEHPRALNRHDPKEPIADLYAQLVEQLQKPGWAPLGSRFDASSSSHQAQQLAFSKLYFFDRIMDDDAYQAIQRKDFAAALPYAMAQMQLEDNLHHGGFMRHREFRTAGVINMAMLRNEVSTASVREVLASLRRFEREREPVDVAIQREQAWEERATHWRFRLRRLKVLNDPDLNDPVLSSGINKRLDLYREIDRVTHAYHQLLATELALRLFHEDEARLPGKLDELVPKYLDEVPLDPFSDRPLVYRVTDGKHCLYTVWTNGVDDGGNTGTGNVAEFKDYDLNSVVRVWAKAKDHAKEMAASSPRGKTSMQKALQGGATKTVTPKGAN